MLQAHAQMGEPQYLWRFDHPNRADIPPDSDPVTNYHNTRRGSVVLMAEEGMVVHGLVGYFESVLYGDVTMSISPCSRTPGMFSWFPISFPLRYPVIVPAARTSRWTFGG